MLFSQFFYYRAKSKPSQSLPSIRSSSRLLRHASEQEHYRQISTAAANVAVAAALAASDEDLSSPQRMRNWASIDGIHDQPTRMSKQEADEVQDEVDEEALNALADSFHSESGRKRVSWSQERYGPAVTAVVGPGRGGSRSSTRQNVGGTLTLSPILSKRSPLHPVEDEHDDTAVEGAGVGRGRPLQRELVDSPIDALDMENQDILYVRTPRERKESRASRKSASLVFLGVWALFSVGSVLRSRSLGSSIGSRSGFVISDDITALPVARTFERSSEEDAFLIPSLYSTDITDQLLDPSPSNEPSTERVLGRLSAWLCTTLYLTSRLPQIWKNVCGFTFLNLNE